MSLLFSHPVKKLTLLAAFGGGYVLGAKAGRERYEKIKQTAQHVAEDPRVQQATAQAQEFVRETTEKVKDDPRVKDVAEKVGSVTHQGAGKVEDAVDSAKHAAPSSSTDTQSAPVPTPPTPPSPTATPSGSTGSTETNPLLADQHVETEETVVYSSGPDVAESVEELTDDGDHRNA